MVEDDAEQRFAVLGAFACLHGKMDRVRNQLLVHKDTDGVLPTCHRQHWHVACIVVDVVRFTFHTQLPPQ